MRTIIVALIAMLILSTPALAKDWSFSIDAGSHESRYDYGWDYYNGGYSNAGAYGWSTTGLSIGVGGDGWNAHYSTYPTYPSYPNQGYAYPSIIREYPSIIGTHPNDRGGYRVYIPRGYEPGYIDYGDYTNVNRVTPRVRTHGHRYSDPYNNYYADPYRYNGYVNNQGYPYYPQTVVYTPQRRGTTVISNGGIYYTGSGYGTYEPGYQSGGYAQPDVDNSEVTYDYSTTNNYYYGGETPTPQRVEPYTPPAEFQDTPSPQENVDRPFGTRFYADVELPTPSGSFICRLEGSTLSVETAGVATVISDSLDPGFGAFAAWHPQSGFAVIYRVGPQIVATYLDSAGKWWHSPLPANIQFSDGLTLGLVGGHPWAVFNDTGDRRVVMSFEAQSWLEIGSGTSSPAQ